MNPTAVVAATMLSAGASSLSVAEESRKPNIILILADDP